MPPTADDQLDAGTVRPEHVVDEDSSASENDSRREEAVRLSQQFNISETYEQALQDFAQARQQLERMLDLYSEAVKSQSHQPPKAGFSLYRGSLEEALTLISAIERLMQRLYFSLPGRFVLNLFSRRVYEALLDLIECSKLIIGLPTIPIMQDLDGQERIMRDYGEKIGRHTSSIRQRFMNFSSTVAADVLNSTAHGYEIDRVISLVDEGSQAILAGRVLAETEAIRDQAEEARDATLRAAGHTADVAQANHYAHYADREHKAADQLRIITGVLLVALSGVIGYFSFTINLDLATIGPELARLGIGVPIAVLAAYLGRESARHRENATWAYNLSMQLNTFDAFIKPMDTSQQALLREAFAAHLFRGASRTKTVMEQGPSVMGDLEKIIRSFVDGAKDSVKKPKQSDEDPKDGAS